MKHKIVLISFMVVSSIFTVTASAVDNNDLSEGWQQVNESGFGSIDNEEVVSLRAINDYLFAGTVNGESGAQIWKMDANGNWNLLMEGGFGEDYNIAVTDMVLFKDDIYAGTFGAEIWRSNMGNSWNRVVEMGFGHSNNAWITRLLPFKGMLYCGTASTSETMGGEIWRSSTGNSGSWEQIADQGVDSNPNNKAIVSFAEHDDYLYVSTHNASSGTEVWRTLDGNEGEQSNSDGFGDPRNTMAILEPYNGYLYAGTAFFSEGPGSGAELWRCKKCDKPADWMQVQEAKGFGDTNNLLAIPIAGTDGKLYVVTLNNKTGMQVLASEDGKSFSQINQSGFGDIENHQSLLNGNAFYLDFLYIGTSNTNTGGQVWKRAYLSYMPFSDR